MRKRLISLCAMFALLAGLMMPVTLAIKIPGDGDSRDIAVTLDGTPIADGLEFPADHTVTITTTASTVITGNVFFTGSTGRQELIFTGNAPLKINGDIMTGNNGDSVTLKGGADVTVTGSISTGGSGIEDGLLIVTDGGRLTVTESEYQQSVDHLILGQGVSIVMHRTLSPHSELELGEDAVLELDGHGSPAIVARDGYTTEQTEEYRKTFYEFMKGLLPLQYHIGEYEHMDTGVKVYTVLDENEEPVESLVLRGPSSAPVLAEIGKQRSSDTSAVAVFSSTKAGTYHYLVTEPDAPEPDSDSILSGTSVGCKADENQIELNHLSAGEKWLYIQAINNDTGKKSGILKIMIPAYDDTDEPEKPAIQLTAGEAVRSSAAAAEVGFSSSAAGTYYYAVCAKGEEAQGI